MNLRKVAETIVHDDKFGRLMYYCWRTTILEDKNRSDAIARIHELLTAEIGPLLEKIEQLRCSYNNSDYDAGDLASEIEAVLNAVPETREEKEKE